MWIIGFAFAYAAFILASNFTTNLWISLVTAIITFIVAALIFASENFTLICILCLIFAVTMIVALIKLHYSK